MEVCNPFSLVVSPRLTRRAVRHRFLVSDTGSQLPHHVGNRGVHQRNCRLFEYALFLPDLILRNKGLTEVLTRIYGLW